MLLQKTNQEDFVTSNAVKYIKLDDALALLPTNNMVGPKPTHLREALTKLPGIFLSADLREEIENV